MQDHEVNAALAALQGLASLDNLYVPNDLEPIPQCIRVLGASAGIIGAVLNSWCCATNAVCVRPTKISRAISGPYFKPEKGGDPVFLACNPIADDKAEKARKIVFEHDPTAQTFVHRRVTNSMSYATCLR